MWQITWEKEKKVKKEGNSKRVIEQRVVVNYDL